MKEKVCKICGCSQFLCNCHEKCTVCGEYIVDCECNSEDSYNSIDFWDDTYSDDLY